MSTTVSLTIAFKFSKNGIVVDVLKDDTVIPLWDCTFWSDFANEEERFFIGSLEPFAFKSIRNLQLMEYYDKHVPAIGIFMIMIQGWPYEQSVIKNSAVQILSDLTSDIVNDCHSPFVPLYIHNLFGNIAQK